MSRRVHGATAALVILALGGCAGAPDASSPENTTITDSSGVRVVTNVSGSIEAAESWSLSRAPVSEFGAAGDGDVTLSSVTAVRPLDGGRVVVGMNRPARVLLLKPDGSSPTELGRAGGGPGEFARVSSVVSLGGDSLAVWDPSRRRMSVFTTDGEFVRDVDLSDYAPGPAPDVAASSGTSRLLSTGSGSLVVFGLGVFDSEQGVKRAEAPSYRVTPSGEELAGFGPFPGRETYLGSRGATWVLFGASTSAATSGDLFVVGTSEAPEFRVYAPSGSLRQIVRWPDHDRTVEGRLLSDWSEFVDAQLGSMPEPRRDRIRETLESLPRAEQFPAYGTVMADERHVWVGEYPGQLDLPGILPGSARVPERRWLVFDADGALVATVRTPEGLDPYVVQDGRVWGVFTDELGVQSVRAHELATR